MPILRNIRASKAIRAFEKAGGLRRRGKGDHVNIKMLNSRIITIPGKGIVKIGLLKDALREAGLNEAQFLEFLR